MNQFKFIIRGRNKGNFQRKVLELLKISNHNAFICREGAGIRGLTYNQIQKTVEYFCTNYPNLTFIVKSSSL